MNPDLSASATPSPDLSPKPKLRWGLLLLSLFGPVLLTSLVAAGSSGKGDLAVTVGLIAGGVGGIGAGVALGLRFGREAALKVILSCVFAVPCGIATIVMSMFGCLAAGYHFNVH